MWGTKKGTHTWRQTTHSHSHRHHGCQATQHCYICGTRRQPLGHTCTWNTRYINTPDAYTRKHENYTTDIHAYAYTHPHATYCTRTHAYQQQHNNTQRMHTHIPACTHTSSPMQSYNHTHTIINTHIIIHTQHMHAVRQATRQAYTSICKHSHWQPLHTLNQSCTLPYTQSTKHTYVNEYTPHTHARIPANI